MDLRARFLVLAMVAAFGLAFALPVSADPPEPPEGCKNSQVVEPNPNCTD